MFYSRDLLSRRGSNEMSVVWLLGINYDCKDLKGKRLKKLKVKQINGVDVHRVCEAIQNGLFTEQAASGGHQSKGFSLHLAAILSRGVVKIMDFRTSWLLSEAHSLLTFIKSRPKVLLRPKLSVEHDPATAEADPMQELGLRLDRMGYDTFGEIDSHSSMTSSAVTPDDVASGVAAGAALPEQARPSDISPIATVDRRRITLTDLDGGCPKHLMPEEDAGFGAMQTAVEEGNFGTLFADETDDDLLGGELASLDPGRLEDPSDSMVQRLERCVDVSRRDRMPRPPVPQQNAPEKPWKSSLNKHDDGDRQNGVEKAVPRYQEESLSGQDEVDDAQSAHVEEERQQEPQEEPGAVPEQVPSETAVPSFELRTLEAVPEAGNSSLSRQKTPKKVNCRKKRQQVVRVDLLLALTSDEMRSMSKDYVRNCTFSKSEARVKTDDRHDFTRPRTLNQARFFKRPARTECDHRELLRMWDASLSRLAKIKPLLHDEVDEDDDDDNYLLVETEPILTEPQSMVREQSRGKVSLALSAHSSAHRGSSLSAAPGTADDDEVAPAEMDLFGPDLEQDQRQGTPSPPPHIVEDPSIVRDLSRSKISLAGSTCSSALSLEQQQRQDIPLRLSEMEPMENLNVVLEDKEPHELSMSTRGDQLNLPVADPAPCSSTPTSSASVLSAPFVPIEVSDVMRLVGAKHADSGGNAIIFQDLFVEGVDSRRRVAVVFSHLLALEAKSKVELKQKDPFGPLEINTLDAGFGSAGEGSPTGYREEAEPSGGRAEGQGSRRGRNGKVGFSALAASPICVKRRRV